MADALIQAQFYEAGSVGVAVLAEDGKRPCGGDAPVGLTVLVRLDNGV